MCVQGTGALDVLDAAYDVVSPDAAWLAGVARATRPLFDRGLGVCAYFTEVGGPGEIRNWGHVGELARDAAAMYEATLRVMGPEAMRQIHMVGPFGSSTRLPSVRLDKDAVLEELGASTAAAVLGLDAEGRGISLATWSPPGAPVPPRRGEAAFWARVAPHLACAARLRRALRARPDVPRAPEAVLDPGGRVVHAEGDARDALARDALRDASVRVDRARAHAKRIDAGEALTLWRCMVERRWTIVDQFERDGRRYVVAYPNVPASRVSLEALTPRERAVAMAAALGHANKVIAYELGIAESTVATLLGRAARKLGVASRVELVRRLRASPLLGPAQPERDASSARECTPSLR